MLYTSDKLLNRDILMGTGIKKFATYKSKHVPARILFSVFALALCVSLATGLNGKAAAAACSAPATDYGTVTASVSIPTSTTYRVWSRLNVPSSTNSTYMLEVDGSNCYIMGGSNLTTGTWVWTSNPSGSTTPLNLSLTAGNHSIKMIGNAANVQLDRIILTSDTTCVPTGVGDNCYVPADTTAPTVSLTSPTANSTVSGAVAISANASDNIGVTKTEFYVNSSLVFTGSAAPYSYQWDTTKVVNGNQLVTAKAYDATGNVSSDSVTVIVQNGDAQAPSTPTGLVAQATDYSTVALNWVASTDNVGVTGYTVTRNGVPVAKLGAVTSYQDTGLTANTAYSYSIKAFDAAGNTSSASSVVSVTTPNVPDSQVPTTPLNLSASAVSSSQINLSWAASTDNVGVAAYDIYRSDASSTTPTKVASVTTTSYGNTGLKAGTTYTYYVVARDAAGNVSNPSATASATTAQATVSTYRVSGIVKSNTGQPIAYATVSYSSNGRTVYVQTDTQGVYAVQGLTAGTYKFNFTASGYQSKSSNVKIKNSNITLNVSLRKR
jgi:fibronectin type 3 domain-containing protein